MKSFKQYITEVERYEMSLPSVQDIGNIGTGLYNLGMNHIINSTIDGPLYWTKPLQPYALDILTTLPYMMPGIPIHAVDSTSIPLPPPRPEGDGWYWDGPEWDGSDNGGGWERLPRPEGDGWIWDDEQEIWYNVQTGETQIPPGRKPPTQNPPTVNPPWHGSNPDNGWNDPPPGWFRVPGTAPWDYRYIPPPQFGGPWRWNGERGIWEKIPDDFVGPPEEYETPEGIIPGRVYPSPPRFPSGRLNTLY